MYNKFIIAALTASIITSATACSFVKINDSKIHELMGENETSVETSELLTLTDSNIPVARFDRIELNGGFDVEYTIGEPSLRISAPASVLEHIMAYVKDGRLVVKPDKNNLRYKDVKIYLSSWALKEIVVNGAVDFEAENGISAENLDIKINGAGDLDIKGLKADNVKINVNGAGDVDVERLDCNFLYVEINGAGDAKFEGNARKAEVSIHGAGDIDTRRLICPDLNTSRNGIGRIRR